jgi:hypothetical protein
VNNVKPCLIWKLHESVMAEMLGSNPTVREKRSRRLPYPDNLCSWWTNRAKRVQGEVSDR